MKSNNHENVALSKARGVWSTPPQNEHKLNRAFQEHRNVILIYSVKESGRFQGFARLASEADHTHPPVPWILPPGLNSKGLTGVFTLDWICRRELPFSKTLHLFNPLNDGKPVKIGRDGQEVEPVVAEELCRLFPEDDSSDLLPLLKRIRSEAGGSARRSRKKMRMAPQHSNMDRRLSYPSPWSDREHSPRRHELHHRDLPRAHHSLVIIHPQAQKYVNLFCVS